MGLDQYLYAERRFDPFSDDTAAILPAGTTIEELQRLSKLDPREHETSVYLSRWNFDREHNRANVLLAEAVERAAGLLDFATEHSQGGNLGWRDDYVYVDITAVYWRKSNQIHRWFVENCQDGVDNCGSYPVRPEQLMQLRSLCHEVVAAQSGDDNKTELLPTTSGFFFGGTEYDEWYYKDLADTVADLDRVLHLAASLPGTIHWSYRSSW